MSRKLRLSRWAIVALAVVVALGSVGITYARMKGPDHPGHGKPPPVATTGCSDPFTWVATNDDGHLDKRVYDGVMYDPIDPGDDGSVGTYDYWGEGDDTSSNDPWDPAGEVPPGITPTIPEPGDVVPRYTKDVARTTAWIHTVDEVDDTITVWVENAYPLYFSTVFYALECPESRQGWVREIILEEVVDDESEANPFDYITVIPTLLEEDQLIPGGGEVMGALHVLVHQNAAQNATYKFRLTIHTECKIQKHGTAYAYGGPPYYTPGYAHCFFEYGFKNWGWTNGLLEPGFYVVFPMYVGASDCLPSPEKLVGWVTINYDGSMATVDYEITKPGYTMDTTHVWIGDEPFPRWKGKYTNGPGKYGNIHLDLGGATTDHYEIDGLSGDVWVIAHAGVYWYE